MKNKKWNCSKCSHVGQETTDDVASCNCCDNGKHRNNFGFFPTAQFKMMMNRRHTEQPLTVGKFEIPDLQDHGIRLTHIDNAAHNDNQRKFK